MREITHHKTPGPSRGNQVRIEAGEGGQGSAPTIYYIHVHNSCLVVPFMTATSAEGLTNEALLAIVQDRLERFQEGQYPCEENEGAVAHVASALALLHHRTERRVEAGIEGQLKEATVEEKKRLWIEDDKLRVDIGETGLNIPVQDLRDSWGRWQQVESILRHFDPAITPEEMTILEGIATTDASKNGLAEVKCALANTALRKKNKGKP